MPWPSAMRASIGMKWFRSNIKHGSRLALFALALQLALSFGHFHGGVAQAAPAMQSGLANNVSAADPVGEDAQQRPASNQDSDQQQGDVCAICAVVALANAMLFATPPLLLLPQAIEILYLSTDAEFAHLNSARLAFQPRAPPLS
jgi:Protein of unknown function (DUF2946)